MARTRLVLVRHGQTDGNASGRFQGQMDVPLNEHGRAQAAVLAPYVAALAPRGVVASDLSRAQETAAIVAASCHLPVETDAALREIHVGGWQWRTPEDVVAEAPWFEEFLRAGRDFRRSDTGETASEAGERVRGALERVGHEHPVQTTVVVGHGLALRVGLAFLLGLDFAGSNNLSGLWNCSWTVLEHRDRWRLLSYNNVAPGYTGALASPSSR